MDCRETQTLLSAFHDGELPAADRARVEEHLRECRTCAALLADLARVDRAAGVPDPGPAYWNRFNARVIERVAREADGPQVVLLRPKHGWMRQQFRYLVPAAAAAMLVVVVVRYGGMVPVSPIPTAPTAVSEPAAPKSADQRMAKVKPAPRAAKTAESTAGLQSVPPPLIADEWSAAITLEERGRPADRYSSELNGEASRDREGAPSAMSAPSPGPPMTFRGTFAGSPPVPAADGVPGGMHAERKKMAGAASMMAEQEAAGKSKSASGMRMSNDLSAEAPPAPASPCERARTLADGERFREAETAQRTCLAGDLPDPAREKGLVFLAELLDRQSRFAEADEVIAEVDRQFQQSRPLDLYRQRRPMVQTQPWEK